MSRLHNAVRSLASGYAAMVSNALYTLASAPLALHYLSKPEFGLWSVVMQIGTYLALIDLGISGSVSRILIDHKDTKEDGLYGSVILTGCIVLLVQGGFIIIGGLALSLLLPAIMDVPKDLSHLFRVLAAAQFILSGFFFAGRIWTRILEAHQRFDLINYSQI